jgi:hypothetical protein
VGWGGERRGDYLDLSPRLSRTHGRATSQVVSCRLPAFDPWSSHVGFSVDKLALGAGFLRILLFPLPIIIPQNSPFNLSSGPATIGQLAADVPS